MHPTRSVLAIAPSGDPRVAADLRPRGQQQAQPARRCQPVPITQLDLRQPHPELDGQRISLGFSEPTPIKDILLLLVRDTRLSVIPDPSLDQSVSRRHQERHDSRSVRSDPRAAGSRLQRARPDHPCVPARARNALLQHRLRHHAAQRQPLDCRDDRSQRQQPRARRRRAVEHRRGELAASLVRAARARPRAAARRR